MNVNFRNYEIGKMKGTYCSNLKTPVITKNISRYIPAFELEVHKIHKIHVNRLLFLNKSCFVTLNFLWFTQ